MKGANEGLLPGPFPRGTLKLATDFDSNETEHPVKSSWHWLTLGAILSCLFTVCAIFQVWLYIQQVQNGYRLAKLYAEHEQAQSIQRKLRLEWVRFEDPFQLEEIGRNQFGLNPPTNDQKVFIR